jgi:hypothetical protein
MLQNANGQRGEIEVHLSVKDDELQGCGSDLVVLGRV